MRNLADDILCFDERILKNWKYIPIYDITVQLLKSLGFKNVNTDGDELIFNELAKMSNADIIFSYCDSYDDNYSGLIVSDLVEKPELERSIEISEYLNNTKAKIIIFCNELELYSYFNGKDTEIFKFIRPIIISSGKNKKMIYIYTKEKNIMNKVDNFLLERKLTHTEITININGISKNEAEKINILEGILAATEKRLESYIKEKKNMEKVNENISNL
jgi:hypothetical protein